MGSHFSVNMDNVATSYFQPQKKLSPKHARCQDFLAESDYTLEYKPGTVNVVANALSRKAESAAISQVEGTIMACIREGMERDLVAMELVKLSNEGKVHRFWIEDGLLYTKDRRSISRSGRVFGHKLFESAMIPDGWAIPDRRRRWHLLKRDTIGHR